MGGHAKYADPLLLPIQEPIHNVQTKVQMLPLIRIPRDAIALASESLVL